MENYDYPIEFQKRMGNDKVFWMKVKNLNLIYFQLDAFPLNWRKFIRLSRIFSAWASLFSIFVQVQRNKIHFLIKYRAMKYFFFYQIIWGIFQWEQWIIFYTNKTVRSLFSFMDFPSIMLKNNIYKMLFV